MRWINRLTALAALLAVSAVWGVAQTQECTEEFKTATYSKWYADHKDKQDEAFKTAEEYIRVCPTDESPYGVAIKKFHAAYKAATSSINNKNQMEEANVKKNYPEVVRLGKTILASEPDYVRAHLLIAIAGYSASATGNTSLMSDAAESAKKAIEMIEKGKSFEPYTSKDQALGSLNYIIGKATIKNAPADAIPFFLKAARLNADLRKDTALYLDLATAYEVGPRARLTDEYKAKQGPNQTETPESKLVLENLNQVIDRQIDAWARAAAVTTDATQKNTILGELAALYEYRNKSKTGLNELVAGVLAKPIPDVPTPLTSLPSPPSAPPATGSTPAGSAPGSAMPAATGNPRPASNPNSPGPATSPTTPAKPTASPTPKPRQRRSNHRGQ